MIQILLPQIGLSMKCYSKNRPMPLIDLIIPINWNTIHFNSDETGQLQDHRASHLYFGVFLVLTMFNFVCDFIENQEGYLSHRF